MESTKSFEGKLKRSACRCCHCWSVQRCNRRENVDFLRAFQKNLVSRTAVIPLWSLHTHTVCVKVFRSPAKGKSSIFVWRWNIVETLVSLLEIVLPKQRDKVWKGLVHANETWVLVYWGLRFRNLSTVAVRRSSKDIYTMSSDLRCLLHPDISSSQLMYKRWPVLKKNSYSWQIFLERWVSREYVLARREHREAVAATAIHCRLILLTKNRLYVCSAFLTALSLHASQFY